MNTTPPDSGSDRDTQKPFVSCRGDHEWQFCCEPFEQDGGTVEINFEQCIRCDATRELEPDFTPEPDFPSLLSNGRGGFSPERLFSERDFAREFGGIG